MPINHDVVGYTTEPTTSSWNSKDCLLYALGVGAGILDPVGFELEFTTENSQGVTQKALPTFPVVVPAGAGLFEPVGKFNSAMLVHSEQSVTLHSPVPVGGNRERSVDHHRRLRQGVGGASSRPRPSPSDASSGEPVVDHHDLGVHPG